MTAIASTGSYLLNRIGASRANVASTPAIRESAAAELPTRVTLGKGSDGAVYGDPRAKSGFDRVWSSPVGDDDNVSALMARNRGMNSYRLADQWRGLGGALLARFGETGKNYAQTLVDDPTSGSDDRIDSLSPEQRTQWDADARAMQTAALAGVTTYAPTAGVKIQTRSGQSVEIKIAVNPGFGGIVGMKVELRSSGAMNAAERAAVQQLSDGLDRALEGLGRDDAVGFDLSGLMGYDRQVLASVDLRADNQSHQPLGTFSLHLGDDRRSIALKGSDGELALNVNTGTPLGNTPAAPRRAAIQRTLDRMDSAGARGQANAALVEQMKSAFETFQSGPSDAATAGQAQLSGLADFDAHFGGDTVRHNRFGSAHQAGHLDYQLSQTTATKDADNGGRSVAQTVSEQLSADFRTAAGADGMLDVGSGHYSTTSVRDSSEVTTLIDSTADRVTRVLRKTDEVQRKTVTDDASHRTADPQSWPSQRSFVERLH